MVGLGAFNRYRLIPETAEAEAPTEAVRRIVGNVRFEAGLGIAVLVLAGLLTAMTPAGRAGGANPPRGAAAPPAPRRISGPEDGKRKNLKPRTNENPLRAFPCKKKKHRKHA